MMTVKKQQIRVVDRIDIQFLDVKRANDAVQDRRTAVRVVLQAYRDLTLARAASRDVMDREYFAADIRVVRAQLLAEWRSYRQILKFSHLLMNGYFERLGLKK